MELLQQIVAQGYSKVDQLKSDSDFAGLHADPRFSALLGKMGPAVKYANVLSSDTKWESKLLASLPVESLADQLKPLLAQGWRPFAIAIDSNVLLTLRRENNAGTAITTERPSRRSVMSTI